MRFKLSLLIGLLVALPAFASDPLVQVTEDFSQDPQWDHYQNRIIGTQMPVVIQDFGWQRTNHTGSGPGEIGGRVENSRKQAYYAMPLGKPLTFNDRISASGKLAVKHIGLRGVAYIGFFNSQRHTWRVWNSLAIRIWEEHDLGQVMFDWMSADWRARGAETAIMLKPDGAVHTWSFEYDPDAKADPNWSDPGLQKHVTARTGNSQPYELQGEEYLLERMMVDEPDLTREQLHRRLLAGRDRGWLEYFHRHDQHRWWKRPDAGQGHGRVTLTIDDNTPYILWFDNDIRQAPAQFDRFGLFNIARFGTRVEVYLGDLTVNGEKIELTQDPQWEGHNNRSQYTEPNFHGMQSFGWAQTQWAGDKPGEIGGLFWRTEPQDPLCAYYADDVGKLTLDDPISFSGMICFTSGMTDAAAYFGYFNRDSQIQKFTDENSDIGMPSPHTLGLVIADRSSIGYELTPIATSGNRESTRGSCGVFTPDRKRHRFTFNYDPDANDGIGRVTVTLGGKETVMDLSRQVRDANASFDRFGLANVRRGGHSVEFYLDDVSYTARRSPNMPPRRVPQSTLEVPYPHEQGGRRY